MASLMLLLGLLCLAPLVAAQSISRFPGYSCAAPGYIVAALAGGVLPGFYCTEDPCSTAINACGTGNTCTTREAAFPGFNFLYFADCKCQAPYVPATVTVATNVQLTTCYIPGQSACEPNPCQNNQRCTTAGTAPDGTPIYAQCACNKGQGGGRFCQNGGGPVVLATVDGVTGQMAQAVTGNEIDRYCGNTPFPFGCVSADLQKYVCCTVGCGPNTPDGETRCLGERFVPQPNDYIPDNFFPGYPDQGWCGVGYARNFPNRCFFKDDPERYVCCDAAGCDGYNADGVTPHCKINGYVPPGYGALGLLPLAGSSTSPTATTGAPVATTAQPTSVPVSPTAGPASSTSAPVPAAAPARTQKTLVPPSTACPPVDGFYTNSCFNRNGSMHVCCLNPDSCGPFDEKDNPTCTNGRYYVFT